jgi:hypothetical protein
VVEIPVVEIPLEVAFGALVHGVLGFAQMTEQIESM